MSATQIAYDYAAASANNGNNGIWVSNLDGSNAHQIIPSDPQARIASVSLSPDGRYVLYTITPIAPNQFKPEQSFAWVADIATRQSLLIDPNHFVSSAGWSPNGSALVYTVRSLLDESQEGAYLTDAPGQSGRLLLAGKFLSATPTLRQSLIWGANNTILLSTARRRGLRWYIWTRLRNT